MDLSLENIVKDFGSSFLPFSFDGKPFLFHYSTFEMFEIDQVASSLINKLGVASPLGLSNNEKEAFGELRSLLPFKNKEGKETSIPVVSAISLELNHICNLRCKYCYVFANDNHILPENAPKQMKWETAKSVVDYFLNELPNGGSFFIRLFGGEPLLSFPLIKKIVSYVEVRAGQKNITTEYMLITNGTILTDEIISFFKNHDVNVAFSIDGSEKKHNELRPTSTGQGSFYKIEENRNRLEKEEISNQPIANVVVNRQNLGMFDNYINLLNLGYRKIHFNFVFTDKATLQLETSDFIKLKEEYLKILDYISEDIENRSSSTTLISDVFERLKGNQLRENFCAAGKGYLGIGIDGSFYPCHRFVGVSRFKLGDPITGIDNEAREFFLKPHIESRPICKVCPVRMICGGGCGHTNLMYNGKIDQPRELFCLLKKFEVECALKLLLIEGEKNETCKESEEIKKIFESESEKRDKKAA